MSLNASKPFLDTNVVLYAFHKGDRRQDRARELVAAGGVISVQTLNEFTRVARQKLGREWKEVRRALAVIRDSSAEIASVTLGTHERGLVIAEEYGYRIFDALLLAAALEASCDVFYSEDMQHGQSIEGLVIRNPFRRGQEK
jgi:predicted nucleic acid-binding protein